MQIKCPKCGKWVNYMLFEDVKCPNCGFPISGWFEECQLLAFAKSFKEKVDEKVIVCHFKDGMMAFYFESQGEKNHFPLVPEASYTMMDRGLWLYIANAEWKYIPQLQGKKIVLGNCQFEHKYYNIKYSDWCLAGKGE